MPGTLNGTEIDEAGLLSSQVYSLAFGLVEELENGGMVRPRARNKIVSCIHPQRVYPGHQGGHHKAS